MPDHSANDSAQPGKLTRGAWLALTAALLGWMFDGAEMGVFSLVGRPAILNLLGPEHESDVAKWLGVITGLFLVGAATGGVLFGWLGDRIGRVRAMTLSVLTYAVFTSLCGVVNSPFQLGLLRFVASLGMGGEWSLGVALVMEVFPNRSRAFMAGLIGAAANVGYLMVGAVGLGLSHVLVNLESMMRGIGLPDDLVAKLIANQGWRIMMILGIVPALLTFFIRLFVPESQKWEQEKESGNTSNWQTRDLLGVLLGALGPALMVYLYAFDSTGKIPHSLPLRLIATILGLAMAVVGYTYPVVRYLQRFRDARRDESSAAMFGSTIRRMILAASLSGVALLGTWGATQQAPAWGDKLVEIEFQAQQKKLLDDGQKDEADRLVRPRAKENILIWLSVGAIVGTLGAALLGDLLGRRKAYFALCVASFGSVLMMFLTAKSYGPWLLFSAFVAGTCTASFYGWLPLYLPELFRTSVRATGQGFGFNFGRILAAMGSFQLGTLVGYFSKGITLGPISLPGGYASACTILSTIYVVGMVLIWFAPETKGQPLPE